MRMEAAQVIERRPEDVFRFVATDHFGPMADGATARLVRRDRGRVMEGIITVTEYEPARTFAAVSRFGPFTLRQKASLEPSPGGATRLHLAIDTAATGPIRLLLPLMKRQFRTTMSASLLTIKQHLEAQTPR
jgi:hypothetical protein